MKRKSIATLPFVALLCLGNGACEPDQSGSVRETAQTLQSQEQAAVTVGMPAIQNFTEKRMLKEIYELRDRPKLVTYTYIVDLVGKRHKVCPTTSIGFGFPYSTQYTAPEASRMLTALYPDGTHSSTWDHEMVAQPEPNGLYMPQSADATWVICLAPDGKLAPTYIEPRIEVYTFEMPAVD